MMESPQTLLGMLPFGLRSTSKIFCAISDRLEWVLHQRGVVHLVKYIDDFLVVGPAGSPACQRRVTEMCSVCEELGISLAVERPSPGNYISGD